MTRIRFGDIRRRNQLTSFLLFTVLVVLLGLSFLENPWYRAPLEWWFIPVLGLVGAFLLPAAFGRHYCGQYCPTSFIADGINPVDRAGPFLKSRVLRKVFVALLVGIFVVAFLPWRMGLPASMAGSYREAVFAKLWILWLACPFAIAFPLILGLGFWKGGRTWCNYACPWGAIGVWLGNAQLAVSSDCTGCGACTAACSQPEVIRPAVDARGGRIDANCLTCLACVDACDRGAIGWAPRRGPSTGAGRG